ncbi:putative ribonuclease H-like domain-containing protein [Tanacetum coccineum]
MAFISSSNTNSGKYEVPTIQGVSTTSAQTASVQVSTASTDVTAANLSYDTVCVFIATQPNGSQIKYEDITQIDDDDIEEMDIKWNLALLSMRADRFWKKTSKKITIQGSDITKQSRQRDKKDPKVEEPAPKVMIAIDGIGWDWSYMAEKDENHALVSDEEEVPTKYALMAKSSSSSDNEVYDDSFCSKSCRKNTENLNNKVIKLNEELSDCENDLYNYKRGLLQDEARLVEFKENEIKFYERIRVLERDIEIRDNKIENLMNELEEVKKEKESIDFKIEKFDNASKDLDIYSPPKKDLSWMGLPEFVDDTVTNYNRPTPSIDVSKDVSDEQKAIWKSNIAYFSEQGGSVGNVVSKPVISPKVMSSNFGPPIIEDWDSEDESEVNFTLNKTVRPSIEQVKFDKSTREVVGEKETPKQNKSHPRGNQRNWNNQKSQQLGKDFVMQNKACYNCGSFEHLKFDCKQNTWVNKGKTWTRVDHAHPKLTSFVKTTHSHVKRPFVRKTAVKNKVWVPTARTKFPTIGSKVPTAKPIVVVKGNKGKSIKASACWIWKPKQNQPDQGSNLNGVSGIPQDNINDKGYWNSSCSRHMTGNISYLSEYEPYNGGYVSFGHGGGKITSKGTIKTGKLEFENVYFVKELKYNLFSVSQIYDNKNSVMFTDSECLVLGKDFKLVDDTHVLLRTPRQQNMFTWTFFLKSKDETSSILRNFITEIENLKDLKVKIIRCDNGGEFRNREMDEFCSRKGIKREFSNARTTQQNGVAERRIRTLIEAARTMLADAKLPVTFWAEAVNTACYVQNRVFVNKSQYMTPYELFNGRSPAIGFLRPFGYHVMILNTLDHLGKFDAKGDEGYFVGYSLNSKAFRVFNKRTQKIDENLHVDFLENQPIEKGTGPNWLFDIDSLTKSINYVPVVVT